MIKYCLNFLIVLFVATPHIFAEAKPTADVENYVHELVSESLNILNDAKLNLDLKEQKVRAMLAKNLDATWMGRFTLGREVKTMPEDKLQQFLATYTKYVVSSYANAVSGYKGEKINVKSVDTLSDGFFMVKTQVVKTDGNVINVDYLAHNINGLYKVCDIITEGISLVNSQRSEYASVIGNGGLDDLISELAKRTKE